MVNDNEQADVAKKELAEKNKRLAIVLGLVAAGFYIGFVIINWK
ncbi:MAG: hypothetical protein AAF419_03085 [Pseudomonadota bacterium]